MKYLPVIIMNHTAIVMIRFGAVRQGSSADPSLMESHGACDNTLHKRTGDTWVFTFTLYCP